MSMTARHFANFAPSSRYSSSRLPQAVEAFGDDLARAVRQRLHALVDLDAGERAGLLDQLDQRRAVLGVLADGLVVEDDAGDVFRHRVVGAEQHLAIVAPAVLRAFRADGVEALLDGARGLIGGQDAAARGHHGARNLVEFRKVHRFLHLRAGQNGPRMEAFSSRTAGGPSTPRRRGGCANLGSRSPRA